MQVWAIKCESEYGEKLEAIFDNKEAADRVCVGLNTLAKRRVDQGSFYGAYTVEEMEVGSQPSDFERIWRLTEVEEEDWREELSKKTPAIRKIFIELGFFK